MGSGWFRASGEWPPVTRARFTEPSQYPRQQTTVSTAVVSLSAYCHSVLMVRKQKLRAVKGLNRTAKLGS